MRLPVPVLGEPNGAVPARSRTGSWRDINNDARATAITRRWLGFAIQHGTNPTDGLYTYAVVPNATPDRTRYLATVDRGVAIVGHNDRCHAVRQPSTGLTMIDFWQGSPLRGRRPGRPRLRGDRPGTRRHAHDRGRQPGAPQRHHLVTVTPAQTGYRLVSREDRVTVVTVGASIVLDVATSGYGRSYTAEFARTP